MGTAQRCQAHRLSRKKDFQTEPGQCVACPAAAAATTAIPPQCMHLFSPRTRIKKKFRHRLRLVCSSRFPLLQ